MFCLVVHRAIFLSFFPPALPFLPLSATQILLSSRTVKQEKYYNPSMTGILANDGAFSFAMQEEMTQGATDSNI
jgi:hypothetical protein